MPRTASVKTARRGRDQVWLMEKSDEDWTAPRIAVDLQIQKRRQELRE